MRTINSKILLVRFGRVGDLAEELSLPLDFSYSAPLAAVTVEAAPFEREVAVLLLEAAMDGYDFTVGKLPEALRELGLTGGGIFDLLALVRDAPELIGREPIYCPRLLDFTHDPQFPREFLYRVSLEGNKLALRSVSYSEYLRFSAETLVLGVGERDQFRLPLG